MDEVSSQPWDPMDPPEVGPRRSPGLSGPVGPGEVKYRAARLRTWRPAVSGIKARGRRQGGEEEARMGRRYPPYPRTYGPS